MTGNLVNHRARGDEVTVGRDDFIASDGPFKNPTLCPFPPLFPRPTRPIRRTRRLRDALSGAPSVARQCRLALFSTGWHQWAPWRTSFWVCPLGYGCGRLLGHPMPPTAAHPAGRPSRDGRRVLLGPTE